jgi:hypothetical protein
MKWLISDPSGSDDRLLNLKLRNKWRILLATDFIKITSSKES